MAMLRVLLKMAAGMRIDSMLQAKFIMLKGRNYEVGM